MQFEETEQLRSGPDSDIPELSEQKGKITLKNMQKALKDNIDNMQEQKGNVNGETGIVRKNSKEMLEFRNAATEMKNAFHGLTSRLGTVEEITSELKDMLLETSKTERPREKKIQDRISKNQETTIKGVIHITGIPEREEKEEGTEEIVEEIMTANFHKLLSNHRSRKLREHQVGIIPKMENKNKNKKHYT